jgi:hypothetical protein
MIKLNPPQVVFALHYGRARTPIASVMPDADWPGMWRIAWPDGSLSDLVNLARAKDAAVAIVERGPPARNRQRVHWDRSKRRPDAQPVAQNAPRALCEAPSAGAAP